MTNEEVQTKINPKIVGEVDLPKIELKQFNGKKATIQDIEYDEHSQFGMYAKVLTTVIEGGPEGVEIRATKLLNLVPIYERDENNKVKVDDEGNKIISGYGWGKESKTAMFLKKYECNTLKELIGQEVLVIYEITKTGKEVLTF